MPKYKAVGTINGYRQYLAGKSDFIRISSSQQYAHKNLWVKASSNNSMKPTGALLLPCRKKIKVSKTIHCTLHSIVKDKSQATFYIKYDMNKKTAKLYAVELTNEK